MAVWMEGDSDKRSVPDKRFCIELSNRSKDSKCNTQVVLYGTQQVQGPSSRLRPLSRSVVRGDGAMTYFQCGDIAAPPLRPSRKVPRRRDSLRLSCREHSSRKKLPEGKLSRQWPCQKLANRKDVHSNRFYSQEGKATIESLFENAAGL